ncbi:MAG: aminopeptidase P family protein [Flavobacteriales bacterium]|nr:aminopeptidase P family protein [Flavobacteriales bacterium]
MKRWIFLLLFAPFLTNAQEQLIQLPVQQQDIPTPYDNDLLQPEFFKRNREALRKLMPDNSVAVFFANPVRNRSNDVNYEYHQDPDFYYLSGLTEPHAVLLVFKEDQHFHDFTTNEILFLEKRNPYEESWTGKTTGASGAEQQLGLTKALNSDDFLTLELKLEQFKHLLIGSIPEDIRKSTKKVDLYKLVESFERKTKNLKNMDLLSLPEFMAQLRQVKSEEEIQLIRKAVSMTCDAQIELMKALDTNMTEYQSEAIIEYVFKKNGAEHTGFPSILGSGENSCVIHYNSNRKPLHQHDLLVSDVGAEYHGYTADVTRTLPVNGKFSEEEKIIYEIVLRAQQAGIDSCRAGNKFWDPHRAATKIITKGLLDLGIIQKDFEVQQYFIHGTSHYLGLDVHDAGLYGRLQPGNVITVEPGIYIPEGSPCDPKWWNIGIRIEDDILITESGPENLSEKVPRAIEAIEALMQEEGSFK